MINYQMKFLLKLKNNLNKKLFYMMKSYYNNNKHQFKIYRSLELRKYL